MDIANLQIKVDSTGVTKGVNELSKLEKQSVRTENANRRLAASYVRSNESVKSASLATQRNIVATQRLELQKRKLAKANQDFERGLRNNNNAMGTFIGRVNKLVAAYISLQGARALGGVIDNFIELETKLKNVTKSQAEFEKTFTALQKVSNDFGADLSGISDSYLKLNISLSDSVKQSTDLVKVTELLARGFAASGTAASTAAGATLQLTQGLATDFRAAGQELNSFIEGAPLLASQIAKQLGGESAIDLKRFAEEGKLTAQVFLEALINSEEAIKSFEIPSTIDRSVQRVKNEFTLLIGELDKTLGVSENVTHNLDNMARGFGFLREKIGGAREEFRKYLILFGQGDKLGLEGSVVPPDYGLSLGDFGSVVTQNQITASRSGFNTLPIPAKKPPVPEDFYATIDKKAQDASRKAAEEAKKKQQAIDDVTESLIFETEQLGRNNMEQEVYNNLKRAGVTIDSEAGKKIKDLTEEYYRQNEALQKQKQLAEDLKNAFSSAFEEAILGGGKLSDILRGLEKDLMRILLRQASSGFFESGGAGGDFFSSAASFISGAFGNTPKFATGGSIMVGGRGGIDNNLLSLNGKPLARVSQGESINIDNNGQGGGGVTINMNISTPDADSFRKSQGQILREAQMAASRARSRNG